MTDIVVSYDGSSTDDDGLVLGKMLGHTGASLALAYVRHSREFDPQREELAQHDAERRLDQGAAWIGTEGAPRHIVVNPSTPEGLRQLATGEQVKMIVFGSDYRTSPGRAEPGPTAQGLLEGGPVAVAVAAAGLRTDPQQTVKTITVFGSDARMETKQAAKELAEELGASVVSYGEPADLIVFGSQNGAPAGRIQLSSAARSAISQARGSVLVLPAGTSSLP
jgi:nucleotide-binding universal stress UspA family protein